MKTSERLNWTLLAIGVGLASVFALLWLWAAAGDRVTTYRVLPAGETLTVADTTWRLESMKVDTVSESSYGDVEQPPAGAVFVFVTMSFDTTALDAEAGFYCGFTLSDASELSWDNDSSFIPATEGVDAFCDPAKAGTLQTRFTIPERLLDRIVGVSASFYLDDATLLEEPVVLAGTLSR